MNQQPDNYTSIEVSFNGKYICALIIMAIFVIVATILLIRYLKNRNFFATKKNSNHDTSYKAKQQSVEYDESLDQPFYDENKAASDTASASSVFKQEKPQEKDSSNGCLIIIMVSLALIVISVLLSVLSGMLTSSPSNEQTPQQKVEKPTLSSSQSELGTTINIQIQANDDYDQVVVELILYDKDHFIISQQYLTQVNLKSGNTYVVSYNLSATELFTAKAFKYKLYSYE